jgi:hypothetical protein
MSLASPSALNIAFRNMDTTDKSSIISQEITEHIQEFYSLREQYMEFLFAKKQAKNPIMQYTIEGIKSNYPLEFLQTHGEYIIQIIDDQTREPVFEKKIFLKKSVELHSRARKLYQQLTYKKNIYYEKTKLQQQLNNHLLTKEKLNSLKKYKLISEQEYNTQYILVEQSLKKISEEYESFRKNENKLLIELDIIHKLLLKNMNKHMDQYNKLLFQDIVMSVLQTKNFNKLSDEDVDTKQVLKNHTIMNMLQYQRFSKNKGSLVIDRQTNIYYFLTEEPTGDVVNVVDMDGTQSVVNVSDLIFFKGIHVDKKELNITPNVYADVDDINKEMRLYSYDFAYEIPDQRVQINNYGGKKQYIKEKIQYKTDTSTATEKLKARISKADKDKKIDPAYDTFNIETSPYKYSDLYDSVENTILLFYSLSNNKPYPGQGVRENITEEVLISKRYHELFNTPNWRRILSNFYIDKDSDTGEISPIIVDGFQFATTEHYYQFMKFYNQPNIEGDKLKQYNEYAMKFTMNYDGDDGWGDKDGMVAKEKGSKNSGYVHRLDWNVVDDTGMSFKGYVKMKGIYAKYYQHKNIYPALQFTKRALLIQPKDGNIRNKTNEVAVYHMTVRDLLDRAVIPDWYPNAEKDLQSYYLAIQGIDEKYSSESEESKTDTIDIETDVQSVEEEKDDFTEIAEESETPSKSPQKSVKPTPRVKSPPPNQFIQKEINSNIQILKNIGKYDPTMTEDQIFDSITKYITDINDDDIRKEIQKLEVIVDNMKNKEILEVPPDGDCLYYSLIEMLFTKDLVPINYSRKTQSMNVRVGGNLIRDIHREAALQLRGDVADKLSENLREDSSPIQLVKNTISIEEGSEKLTDIIRGKYIDAIRNSAKGSGGRWGGDLEIGIISALFNTDITVYLSNGTKLFYKANDYTSIYHQGKVYNSDKKATTIELGYYSNYHYVGIVESNVIDLDKEVYEELEQYYYITIEDYNENLYDIAILFSDDVQPLGFYNTKTGKIEYFQFENELEDELFEKVSEILEYIDSPDDDERMKKITYMKNIENNKVYLDKDGDKIEIGIIKLNSRNQSYISF